MNKLVLQKPLMINNKEVKELTYNTAEITAGQFCEAEGYKYKSNGNQPSLTAQEFDNGLHLYLGMMAIIAINPDIDITDLERIKGWDMVQVARIGRNFILTGAGGDSAPKTSGDTSETTPEPTTPAPENSDVID